MFAATSSSNRGALLEVREKAQLRLPKSSDRLALVLTFGPSWRELPGVGTRRDPSLWDGKGEARSLIERGGGKVANYLK